MSFRVCVRLNCDDAPRQPTNTAYPSRRKLTTSRHVMNMAGNPSLVLTSRDACVLPPLLMCHIYRPHLNRLAENPRRNVVYNYCYATQLQQQSVTSRLHTTVVPHYHTYHSCPHKSIDSRVLYMQQPHSFTYHKTKRMHKNI